MRWLLRVVCGHAVETMSDLGRCRVVEGHETKLMKSKRATEGHTLVILVECARE